MDAAIVTLAERHWSPHAALPLLFLLQLLPPGGGCCCSLCASVAGPSSSGGDLPRRQLALAILLYAGIDAGLAGTAVRRALRRDPLRVGADGVTALFVLVAALIGLLLSLYEPARDRMRHAELLAVILLAQAALMAMLATTNLVWFSAASAARTGLVGLPAARGPPATPAISPIRALPAVSGLRPAALSSPAPSSRLGPFADATGGQWSLISSTWS